jgi:hypothetical protein
MTPDETEGERERTGKKGQEDNDDADGTVCINTIKHRHRPFSTYHRKCTV